MMLTTQTYHPSLTLTMAHKRAKLYATIRQFFAQREVLEVQTPILSQAGNTDTFLQSVSANVNYLDKQVTYYLHTSPEFAMKRLLASWQVPIYQICPVFRDNEIGGQHNIEFTMLEWYRPNFSLADLADELSDLLAVVFAKPQTLKQYRYIDAFTDHVGIHPLQATAEQLAEVAKQKGLTINLADDHQGWLDLLFSHYVEPYLGHDNPTIIIDYPPATAALANMVIDDEGNQVAKRFELYINGVEIANAYDELADVQALRQRFEADNVERAKLGMPIMPIDENLLAACDELPVCSGIALGVDRLLMIVTGAKSIDDVIAFTSAQA
ncbi:MAG: EF-P lysine aminoacylase GenX [Gammaproteobacteria bacterium]|nr:MAG: EF-P lysine aminoacylase GenX [Gammaproteobacteria bacterium]